MSRHDLVSAQISNVCITRHAALNAVAYIVCVKQFVMSLPAISLGYWFSGSRKSGTGGGRLVSGIGTTGALGAGAPVKIIVSSIYHV